MSELNPPRLACHTCWTMKIVLSDEDVRREKRYIIQERLGILCGHDEPDITQLAIAVTEADEWEARYMDSV